MILTVRKPPTTVDGNGHRRPLLTPTVLQPIAHLPAREGAEPVSATCSCRHRRIGTMAYTKSCEDPPGKLHAPPIAFINRARATRRRAVAMGSVATVPELAGSAQSGQWIGHGVTGYEHCGKTSNPSGFVHHSASARRQRVDSDETWRTSWPRRGGPVGIVWPQTAARGEHLTAGHGIDMAGESKSQPSLGSRGCHTQVHSSWSTNAWPRYFNPMPL